MIVARIEITTGVVHLNGNFLEGHSLEWSFLLKDEEPKNFLKNTPEKSQYSTTSINGTPASPTSQQQQNHQANKSEDFIQKQQKIIEELMEKVDHLQR